MDEHAAEVAAGKGEVAHAPGVDGEGRGRVGLGLVHEVVGGAVDHHVGPQRLQGRAKFRRPGQVGLVARPGDDLPLQARLQVAAELAVGADQGVLHGTPSGRDRNRSVRCKIRCRFTGPPSSGERFYYGTLPAPRRRPSSRRRGPRPRRRAVSLPDRPPRVHRRDAVHQRAARADGRRRPGRDRRRRRHAGPQAESAHPRLHARPAQGQRRRGVLASVRPQRRGHGPPLPRRLPHGNERHRQGVRRRAATW